MTKRRGKKSDVEYGGYIRKGNGRLYPVELFLNLLMAEKLELALSRLSERDRLKITREYASTPGAALRLILEFDESEVKAMIQTFRPSEAPKNPEPKPPIKDLYEQAKEFLAMTEGPPDPPNNLRGKST